jgi:hypothetical protein
MPQKCYATRALPNLFSRSITDTSLFIDTHRMFNAWCFRKMATLPFTFSVSHIWIQLYNTSETVYNQQEQACDVFQCSTSNNNYFKVCKALKIIRKVVTPPHHADCKERTNVCTEGRKRHVPQKSDGDSSRRCGRSRKWGSTLKASGTQNMKLNQMYVQLQVHTSDTPSRVIRALHKTCAVGMTTLWRIRRCG